jgi:hypothetical protein
MRRVISTTRFFSVRLITVAITNQVTWLVPQSLRGAPLDGTDAQTRALRERLLGKVLLFSPVP